MANEIRVVASAEVTNGNNSDRFNDSFQMDQAAAGGPSPDFVTVGTAEEVISVAELSSPGLMIIENIDPTNFLEYGPESAGAMVKIGKVLPGKFNILTLAAGVVLRAKADTAAVKARFRGYSG